MSDEPVAGFYKTRLVKGGVFVPVQIYFGLPEVDGETQDRAPRWCVVVDGQTDRIEKGDGGYACRVLLDIERYWPWCGRHPVPESEYRYMLDRSRWAKSYAPDRAEASPREAVDWNKRGTVF